MGRLATRLSLDSWAAHSAGLFEECGKAVLFRHAKDHYRSMLRAAPDDATLAELERAGFGVSHDALGAALCESWGLAASAVASVRLHVTIQAGGALPEATDKRAICALSAMAHALLQNPDQLEPVIERVAAPAGFDAQRARRGVQRLQDHLEAAA